MIPPIWPVRVLQIGNSQPGIFFGSGGFELESSGLLCEYDFMGRENLATEGFELRLGRDDREKVFEA